MLCLPKQQLLLCTLPTSFEDLHPSSSTLGGSEMLDDVHLRLIEVQRRCPNENVYCAPLLLYLPELDAYFVPRSTNFAPIDFVERFIPFGGL